MNKQFKSKSKFKNENSEENEQLKSQLARALADYDNLVKRTEEEKVRWVQFSSGVLLTKFLPVLDTLEMAYSHLKDKGLELAIGEFKKVLTDEGLEEIRPNSGDDFNPELMEAIEVVESQGKSGKVNEVVLTGWKYNNDSVLRHAKVKVERSEIPSAVEG